MVLTRFCGICDLILRHCLYFELVIYQAYEISDGQRELVESRQAGE